MAMPSDKEITALHHKYAPNQKVYDLVFDHCRIVAEISLWCAANLEQKTTVDVPLLKSAALLHDIGTYILFDDEGLVANHRMYKQHAILGAKILADEGLDPRIASLVETHILLGMSAREIHDVKWALPERDYIPDSVEGELLCYADRYHSKHPVFNTYEVFHERLSSDLPQQAAKFEAMSRRFGVPDVQRLAEKYGHPVR